MTSAAKSDRISKLAKRWRDLAEVGYERETARRNGWAEHIKRVASEPDRPEVKKEE